MQKTGLGLKKITRLDNCVRKILWTAHCHFMALCNGLPRWYQKTSFWILRGVGKIIETSAPTIRLDATRSRPSMPQPPSFPSFTLDALATTLPIYPGLG